MLRILFPVLPIPELIADDRDRSRLRVEHRFNGYGGFERL